MSSESTSAPPRLATLILPGTLLAVLAVIGYAKLAPSLDSIRPSSSFQRLPDPPTASGLTGVHARLWEDPLEAVYRNDVAGIESHAHYFGTAARLMEAAREQFANLAFGKSKSNIDPLHVMAVMMPGEVHAESSEARRRIRYAVTSALSVSGLHQAFPNRMTYVDVPVQVEIKAVKLPHEIVLRTPVKLFTQTELAPLGGLRDRERVLVLWVNESQLGSKPLHAVCRVIRSLFGSPRLDAHRTCIKCSVIGPSSSATLLAMASEVTGEPGITPDSLRGVSANTDVPQSFDVHDALAAVLKSFGWGLPRGPETVAERDDHNVDDDSESQLGNLDDAEWPVSKMKIYSYRATIGADQLNEQEPTKAFIRGTPPNITANKVNASGTSGRRLVPDIVRTIGTDRQLVKELFAELRLRQAMPDPENDGRHVVIVTERDTLYGRGLHDLFSYKEASPERAEFGIRKSHLHLFTYLRGVDGRTVYSATKDKVSRSEDDSVDREAELPAGPSQYDYLRRVAQQVEQLQARLRREGRGEITTVGVMGSDVYDKLLILRALRSRLPNATYFTTDLDAALSHPSEYDWTRNLIVASHYGRQLHPELQRDAPVFRDSYQTSCYFAALLAVNEEVTSKLLVAEGPRIDPWQQARGHSGDPVAQYLRPLLFEISRTGPYQLTSTDGPWEKQAWYSQLRRSASRDVSLSGLVHPPGSRADRAITLRSAMLATLSFVVAAVYMAAYFAPLRRGLSRLTNLLDEFRTAKPKASDWMILLVLAILAGLVGVVVWDSSRLTGEPYAAVDGISIWPTVLLRLVAIILAVYFASKAVGDVRDRHEQIAHDFELHGRDKKHRRTPLYGRSWVSQALFFFLHPFRWRRLLPDLVFREKAARRARMSSRWRRLMARTSKGAITARVVPQITLFALFVWYLTPLGEPRSRPARGDVAYVIEWLTFAGCVFGVIVLTAIVFDLTQCFRHFAKSIRKATRFSWPPAFLDKSRSIFRDAPSLVSYRATIEMLARLSKAYSKLIVYPSTVLALLILAHLSVFDNWTLPWPLLLLVALCVGAAIYGNLSLRNEVRKARSTVLRLLSNDQLDATQRGNENELKMYVQIKEEIMAERGGAFRPLSEDPIIQAISLPFGGVGGAVLLEQIFRAMG